jgi:hypothetical protein
MTNPAEVSLQGMANKLNYPVVAGIARNSFRFPEHCRESLGLTSQRYFFISRMTASKFLSPCLAIIMCT